MCDQNHTQYCKTEFLNALFNGIGIFFLNAPLLTHHTDTVHWSPLSSNLEGHSGNEIQIQIIITPGKCVTVNSKLLYGCVM